MPEQPDSFAVHTGVFKTVSLKSKFAVHMVLTLIIMGVLGFTLLSGYWREYSQLKQSRQYVRLAVLFAEIGEASSAETKGPMFQLLFAAETPLRQPEEALLSEFNELARVTDAKLAEVRDLWSSMDKSGADSITLGRINEVLAKAEKLPLWRRPVLSLGNEIPDEILKSETYTSRTSHHLELGMSPQRARCQALWDLVKDGYYSELSESMGLVLLYVSRVTSDASMARAITLHSEMLRYHLLIERENGLLAYLISKGARPHGLLSDDIGWLRSLWDRESAAYMNIWSLATEASREGIRKQLSLDSFPRVAKVRQWIAANWTNNDMANWMDADLSQVSTPELVQDLDYSRDFSALQLMRRMRGELVEGCTSQIHSERGRIIAVSIALVLGCLVVTGGFWWMNTHVLRRVWDLSVMVKHVHETGDVSLRIPMHLGDEVGSLEMSFNEMLEAVEEHQRNLEATRSVLETRVLERTQEVQNRLQEVERLNRALSLTMTQLRTSRDHSERSAARLEEANQKLLAANQELESFIYSASHDLRTPLRNIVGFIELLRLHSANKFDEAATHRVQVVLSEAKRLSSLIDGLLAFFRVGRAELRFEQVYIGALVRELRSDLAERAEGRSILWKIGDMPSCVGDRELLKQLMEILLDNAIKFTAYTRETVIEVGSLQGGGLSEELVYFVRDNGAGFNPRYSDKLFRVFQRLHNPRDFEGNGIGLANMKRIVLRHGGRVWAEGAVDAGACFFFALPIKAPLQVLRDNGIEPLESAPPGASG